MSKARIEMVRSIFSSSAELILRAIDGITEEQTHWRVAPQSRSIQEITAHLIRVDLNFLKATGYNMNIDAPDTGSIDKLRHTFNNINSFILAILDNLGSDPELLHEFRTESENGNHTLGEIVMHISQHYHYHFSQLVFIRRAQDRQWDSPMKQWEKFTYQLAEYLVAKIY